MQFWVEEFFFELDCFLLCFYNEELVGGRKESSKRGEEERKEEEKERQKWIQRGEKEIRMKKRGREGK